MSVNKVILVGVLGADPEIKSFANGGKIANVNIATNETYVKDGETKKVTDWHRVIFKGDGLINVVERFLRKGSKVYLEGQLKHRKFTNQAGQEQFITEVVIAGAASSMVMLHNPHSKDNESREQRQSSRSNWRDELDDDIPY